MQRSFAAQGSQRTVMRCRALPKDGCWQCSVLWGCMRRPTVSVSRLPAQAASLTAPILQGAVFVGRQLTSAQPMHVY